MITVDLARRGPATRRKRALTQVGGIAVAATLVLAGCQAPGAPGGYIDLYYDNGEAIFSPLKDTLFAADGVPLCNTPIYQKSLESRFRPYSDQGGLMNSFLFEVVNNEQDPNAPRGELDIPSSMDEAQYRETLERRLGSLDRMYQLTHPFLFDPEFGVESADDMAAIKEELREAFPDMVAGEAPPIQFIGVGDLWIESSAGRFEVGKISDVQLFIDTLEADVVYDGLNNDYFSALKDGEQYLMVRERETGVVTLVNANGEVDIDEIQQYQQYKVLQQPGVFESAAAIVTLQNDGCPQGGDQNFARWWVVNIEFVEPGVAEDPFATDGEEDDPFATDDESPSPSPSPSAE